MRKEHGLTLVDLTVTLAVAAVLLTVGVPSVASFVGNNRVSTQSNDFVISINLARSEAVKRGIPVSMCSSTDQATCADSTNWADGWIIFTDNSGSGGVLDGTDTLLRSHGPLDGDSAFSTTVKFVRYLRTGVLATTNNIFFNLVASNCKGRQRRSIAIRPQGYSNVQSLGCPVGGA